MKKMKIERLKKGVSSGNFAKKIGITYVYLSKIEMGHLSPSVELAEKICKELNDNSNFMLLDLYPSIKNMRFDDYKKLSNDMGYKVNGYLFETI